MLTENLLLLLLFMLAIAAGYALGRRRERHKLRDPARVNEAYFQGLNYLLNDDTDRAVDVFIRMTEADSDAVETHFALGSLFRRKGEVDRAIRVHQNLIARPNLPRHRRQQALFELGQDYTRAGLFDRAENLFLELTDSPRYREGSLRELVAIYEQQKDWDQAIAMRRKLEVISGEPQEAVIAQYLCEQAVSALMARNTKSAKQLLKRAQSQDRGSVRAGLLSAELAETEGDRKTAAKLYRRVIEQDPLFVSEVLPGLARTADGQRGDHLDEILHDLLERHPECRAGVALAALDRPELTSPLLQRALLEHARSDPHLRGVYDLVTAVTGEGEDAGAETVRKLRDVLSHLDGDAIRYRCRECGLKGATLYWLCPSCKNWNSTRPSHQVAFTILPGTVEDSGYRGALYPGER